MTTLLLGDAQSYLQANDLDGWLVHDFQKSNPIFWQIVGQPAHTTRRCFLLVPPEGEPTLLLHYVNANRLSMLPWPVRRYVSLAEMLAGLRVLLGGRRRVAMEYSPGGALPVVSRVDAGTIEMVRALGSEVVSSADLLQYAVARWSPAQLAGHRRAAQKLVEIVLEAYGFIGRELPHQVDELAAVEFIRDRFAAEGLVTEDGPVVAVGPHSGDPHYEPTRETASPIVPGDWVLIDMWAKERHPGAVYADITWVGYVGRQVPEPYAGVFAAVRGARDSAIAFLRTAHEQGRPVEGWEADAVAREILVGAGYGDSFTHRLGHSIGVTVHGNGVNLDGFETRDTRKLIPGLGFSVEPGVYLPQFGVRSEVDVYYGPNGPEVTTPAQTDVVLIR